MSEFEHKLVMYNNGLQTSQTHDCGASDDEEQAQPITKNTRYNNRYIEQLEEAIHLLTREKFSLQEEVATLANGVWVRENQIANLEKQLEEARSTSNLEKPHEEAQSTSAASDFV